jgi:hypothetical protein
MPPALRLALGLCLAVLTSCSPAPVYSQRYAALVPHAAPPLRGGGGSGRPGGELAIGDSSLVELRAPREGDDEVGLFIPASQPRLELRGGNGRFDVGVIGVYGARRGATKLAEDQPSPRGGGVQGLGASIGGRHQAPGSPFALALSAELVAYAVPYVVQQTCVANCSGIPSIDRSLEQRSSTVPVLAVSVVPSYRVGPAATAFAGFSLQNHPVITKGDVDVLIPFEEEPEAGPWLAIASLGVEVEVLDRIRLAALVFQPLQRQPVDYGPTISVFATLPFGGGRATEPPPRLPDAIAEQHY